MFNDNDAKMFSVTSIETQVKNYEINFFVFFRHFQVTLYQESLAIETELFLYLISLYYIIKQNMIG